MSEDIKKEQIIKSIVKTAITSFSDGFKGRHEGEVDDPNGTINMKIHNVFIQALGPEIQYYTALVRSFDSCLGNMLEKMAIRIAELFYDVRNNVDGPLSLKQIGGIANLLEEYKSHAKKPKVEDYQFLREKPYTNQEIPKRHSSDYYLIDKEEESHHLIELKIGGDLDNKKARSEKEAILEQFAILSNTLPGDTDIRIYFATAYNRFGEDKEWKQERVRQFFAEDELLIGRDFWNFVCKLENGYETVLSAYRENAHYIADALKSIKKTYLD